MKKSLLISPTTFEMFKFEDWPPPVGVKTKMDFHVSRGFLALGLQGKDMVFSDKAGPEPRTSSIRRGCSILSTTPHLATTKGNDVKVFPLIKKEKN